MQQRTVARVDWTHLRLYRDHGAHRAAQFMNRLAKLASRVEAIGFSAVWTPHDPTRVKDLKAKHWPRASPRPIGNSGYKAG